MGITAAQLTPVSAASFNLIPDGADYFPDGMYLRNARRVKSLSTLVVASTWFRFPWPPKWD